METHCIWVESLVVRVEPRVGACEHVQAVETWRAAVRGAEPSLNQAFQLASVQTHVAPPHYFPLVAGSQWGCYRMSVGCNAYPSHLRENKQLRFVFK